MREIKRNALVSYSPAQMFALVADFERYPQFLPWVASATLLSREGNQLIGRLEMTRAGVREQFTTRNTLDEPSSMHLQLVDGPFNTLEGWWRFIAIADASGMARGTRVELEMRFEFKNALLNMMFGKAFEASCASLLDSFIKRARELYDNQNQVT